MNHASKNRFKLFNALVHQVCKGCEFNQSGACLKGARVCEKVETKTKQLYYDLLHPHDPCGTCIVRPICEWDRLCDAFRHYSNMKRVARCELTGEVVIFANNKKYLWMGEPDEINYEAIRQAEEHYKCKVDLEFTEQYVNKIKLDPRYAEILQEVREHLECVSERVLSKH